MASNLAKLPTQAPQAAAETDRFRRLTELSSDWYWEQDAELRFVATGGADEGRGGITPEQHVGLSGGQ